MSTRTEFETKACIRSRVAWVTAAILAGWLAGCGGKPAVKGDKVAPADIKIYQSTDLLRTQYTLVQHVWTDSWRTNITFPTFGSEADGVDAMRHIASDSGANGLIHVICLDGRPSASSKQEYYCYGDAIRVN